MPELATKTYKKLPKAFLAKAKQNAVVRGAACRVFEELVEEGLDIMEPDWRILNRREREQVILALYRQLDPIYKGTDPSYDIHKTQVKKCKVYMVTYEMASRTHRHDLAKAATLAESLPTGTWQTRMRLAIASVEQERLHETKQQHIRDTTEAVKTSMLSAATILHPTLDFILPDPEQYPKTSQGRTQLKQDCKRSLKPFLKRVEAAFGREPWLQSLKDALR